MITVGAILDAALRLRDASRKEVQGKLSANDLCKIIDDSQDLVDFVLTILRDTGDETDDAERSGDGS